MTTPLPPWPHGPVCHVDIRSQCLWERARAEAALARLRVAVAELERVYNECGRCDTKVMVVLAAIGELPQP